MKPLPAQTPPVIKSADDATQSLPPSLATSGSSYSKANRRSSNCSTQRAYPWLLIASTGLAIVFCLMYITKPVIQASQVGPSGFREQPEIVKVAPNAVKTAIMPDQDRLPGDSVELPDPAAGNGIPSAESASAPVFEQTNVRIQHILTAEAPGGHLAKIDLDVPVLYQSRNLRWTPAEVAEARELLARLADYQEKSRSLRSEGMELLESWNQLVERSIPSADLRADSPTLPANQQDTADASRPSGLDTTESIQIKAVGK